ncbi:hypothetical protein ACHWQZ_G005665 [Mnemiopsis leidyi]
MPIAQRTVEPTLVCQSRGLTSNLPPSLPSTSLIALTSIIRQLSALSKYADEMFGDVFNEASKYVYRSGKLEERVAALAQALQEKKDNENVLEDTPAPIQEKPEQHILNVYIPRALKEKYHEADRPPPLGVFAQLRSDGRDGMSLYTDPTLFFRQWVYNMNREANVLRNPKKKRLRRSRSSMRPGQPTYIAPPSASPPPPLSYPVYENRNLQDQPVQEEHEDNIYEMLPDQDNSPPAHQSSPQYRHLPQDPSLHFNQPVHFNQSYQFNQSGHFASSPSQNLAASSPPYHHQADLNVSAHEQHLLSYNPDDVPDGRGNSFQRNRSYDLSMQFERDSAEFDRQRQEKSKLQFDNSSPGFQYGDSPNLDSRTPEHGADQYGVEDTVLPIQNSLTSLSLDGRQQQPDWDQQNQIYDNHRLQTSLQSGDRYSADPNDTPFSLDDLPPPPEDLLDTLEESPFPTSTTPYRQIPAAPSPPQDYYDPLPPRVARYNTPISEQIAQKSSPLSNPSPVLNQLERSVSKPPSTQSPAPQSDLLAAIRSGINLRPMKRPQEKEPSPPQPTLFHDVASILQRRKFLMGDMCDGASDSDSETDGEWDDEDDSWN